MALTREEMAQRAEAGSFLPALLTAALTLVFLGCSVLALSAGRVLPAVPFARTLLVVVAVVFTVRGLVVIPQLWFDAGGPDSTRNLAFSLTSLLIGLVHVSALVLGWRNFRAATRLVRWLALHFRDSRSKDTSVSVDRSLQIARKMMRQAQFCFLITLGKDGGANARVLQPFPPQEDFTVWLGTSPRSRKVLELSDDDRATLTYESPGKGFVSLSGRATMCTEMELRQRWWRDTWFAFFPDGPAGDDFAVLKFVPSRIELLHFPARLTPAPFGLKSAVLVREGHGWMLG